MVKIAIDGSRDDVYHFTRTNEHWTPDRTQLVQKTMNGTPHNLFRFFILEAG